MAFLMW